MKIMLLFDICEGLQANMQAVYSTSINYRSAQKVHIKNAALFFNFVYQKVNGLAWWVLVLVHNLDMVIFIYTTSLSLAFIWLITHWQCSMSIQVVDQMHSGTAVIYKGNEKGNVTVEYVIQYKG